MVMLLILCSATSGACVTLTPAEPRPPLIKVTKEVLRDPDTWVPAAGAVLIAATDTDGEISDWAREDTPIFQSTANASEASDNLKLVSELLTYSSILLTESRGEMIPALVGRKLLLESMLPIVPWIKRETKRERPNGRNLASFPSGHAAQAFAYGSLTRISLENSDLDPKWKRTLSISSRVSAIGTGWARIEAGEHYPTDVLTSAALSNILTRVLSNYLSIETDRLNVRVGHEIALTFSFDFSELSQVFERERREDEERAAD